MWPNNKIIQNNLEEYSKMNNFEAHGHACIVCGKQGEGLITWHHLMTRKARPDLVHAPSNLIPVDQSCHNMFHAKGTSYMAEKYPKVKSWLINRGWGYCELMQKWTLSEPKDA